MAWSGINQRGDEPGKRKTDCVCPFYPDNCRDKLMTKEDGKSMKEEIDDVRNESKTKLSVKIFGIFIASLVVISVALGGYFVRNSEKSLDLLLEQNKAISELKVETATIATRQERLIGKMRGTSWLPGRR